MKILIRRLVLSKEPKISTEDATQIAKNLCGETDWQWLELIAVRSRISTWIVRTHYGWRGACAFIKINKKTGEVINAQYYPVSVVFHNPILEVGAVKLPKVSSNRPYNIVKDFLEAIATFVTKAPGRFCSPTPMDVISTFQISVLRKVLKEPD